MKLFHALLILCLLAQHAAYSDTSSSSKEKLDPQVFEMAAFVIYGGEIDTIDGFTGETYHESNEVIEQFREEFNKLLLAYHSRLLRSEYEFMKKRVALAEQYQTELAGLLEPFGIKRFELNLTNHLSIERAILNRLIKDPFFKIEALIVWDLDKLNQYKDRLPRSKYASDIHYNPETEAWERRVTTSWEVSYNRRNGERRYVNKLQGLNLDTNKGYHFIGQGLTGDVPANAFREVKLTYPVFVSSKEPVDVQVHRLKNTFLTNLIHIYDPFSWVWRRNFRFRGGFLSPVENAVEGARFRVTDRDWLNPLLAHLINDIATIRLVGTDEIYSLEMLKRVPVNQNILGTGLDLLNWNEGESRSVKYNPQGQGRIPINFDNPNAARYILLDAYRRFPDQLLAVLANKLTNLDQKVSAKDLVKEALAEVSGIPADIYIKKATAAQHAELDRFKLAL